MKKQYSVRLEDLVRDQELTVVHASKDFGEALICTAHVNRPALQLAGFYDYFDPKRLQAIGRVETTYLESLPQEARLRSVEEFMKFDITALIVCHDVHPLPEFIDMAEKYDRNLFVTEEDTSTFMADLISYMRRSLAPRQTCHGVLVEVYGEGLLITGDSGIGKSETALELIKRGHRLIADDAVEVKRISKNTVVGTAPELIRYYMELRGIGVVDVRHIYGVGAVKPETNIDLVVNFEVWNEEKAYDRLGIDTNYCDILGVKVPLVTIPVLPGRNLAVILELAAMNNRQKNIGYNAAKTLADNYDKIIEMNKR